MHDSVEMPNPSRRAGALVAAATAISLLGFLVAPSYAGPIWNVGEGEKNTLREYFQRINWIEESGWGQDQRETIPSAKKEPWLSSVRLIAQIQDDGIQTLIVFWDITHVKGPHREGQNANTTLSGFIQSRSLNNSTKVEWSSQESIAHFGLHKDLFNLYIFGELDPNAKYERFFDIFVDVRAKHIPEPGMAMLLTLGVLGLSRARFQRPRGGTPSGGIE